MSTNIDSFVHFESESQTAIDVDIAAASSTPCVNKRVRRDSEVDVVQDVADELAADLSAVDLNAAAMASKIKSASKGKKKDMPMSRRFARRTRHRSLGMSFRWSTGSASTSPTPASR